MVVAAAGPVMVWVVGFLALAVVLAAAVAAHQQRLRAVRGRLQEAEAREAGLLRELAAAKRDAAQVGADRKLLSRFIRDLPHAAHEMHSNTGARDVAAVLLNAVTRLLEPSKALVAVARRPVDGEPGPSRSLFVAAASPSGCVPLGAPITIGMGEVGFAVEVQRVMDRRDFDAQPAPTRLRLRDQSGLPDFQPDLVAPLVFKDEAVGVIAIEGSGTSSPETKDAVRLIAHIGSAALYTNARYSEINRTANTDGLTGIYNKRFVTLRLAEEIQKALAETRSVSVFLFDVDNFKHYNDRNGHPAGDRLLQALTKVALQNSRSDTVFGRFGGEEFLMIFPGASKSQAFAAAENLRQAIARYDFPAGAAQPLGCLSISGGVAECPVDATDSATLVRLADEALYAAKSAGRNRVLAFEPRYLGEDDPQEPLRDEEAEETQRRVALASVSPLSRPAAGRRQAADPGARRQAYEASFAEARRLLAEDDVSSALEAARRARQLLPERAAIAQFVAALEQRLHSQQSREDLIVVYEEELGGQGAEPVRP